MVSPERNDIDVSRLFNWGKKFVIVDSKGAEVLTYHVRLPTDGELNRARVHALRKSAELRKKLNNPLSGEYEAYIAIDDLVTKEGLVTFVLNNTTNMLFMEAAKKAFVPYPKEPKSDASLEAQEKYQADLDTYDEKMSDAIRDVVIELFNKKKEELELKTKEELFDEYLRTTISSLCETEMSNEFKIASVFYSSFADELYEKRLFKSPEEIHDLPIQLLTQFLENYNKLDIGIQDLKK